MVFRKAFTAKKNFTESQLRVEGEDGRGQEGVGAKQGSVREEMCPSSGACGKDGEDRRHGLQVLAVPSTEFTAVNT